MKYLIVLWNIFLYSFIISCSKESLKISRKENTAAFSKIEIENPAEVFLIEDSVFYIEIKGTKAAIQKIIYSVKDSILRIKDETKHEWLTPQGNKKEIYIHSLPLKELTLNETCNVQTPVPITSKDFGLIMKGRTNQATLNLNCKTFYFWNNFPTGGKLTLTGHAEILKIWNSAIMTVDASNLLAKDGLIENNSKGTCMVKVESTLEYAIRSSGNIELYGAPLSIINKETTSTGKLIRH